MIPVPEQKIAEFIQMMRRFDIFPIYLERSEYSSSESQHPIYPFLRDIIDEEWAQLIAFFFRGNEMVLEYLNKQ